MLLQKQALLWCIERENPAPPKSEADHPVQFWQLQKADGRVSYVLLFSSTFVYTFFHRRFTLIVRQNTLPISPAPDLICSCYQDSARDATQAWQRCIMRRQYGPVRAHFLYSNLC